MSKSSDHKQAWSLSEDIVHQIDKSISAVESGQVSGQVSGQATGQVTGQAHIESGNLSAIQVGVILNSTKPISMQSLRKELNLGSRYNLRTKHIYNPIGILAGIVNPSKSLVTPERNKLQDEASTFCRPGRLQSHRDPGKAL